MSESCHYTGRFAPSPSGPLHFGSLVAAVASYLDARANKGTWLVRMDDLDPARELSGAADLILSQLDDFGMNSDFPVLKQSSRFSAYERAFKKLADKNLVYPCYCSRQQIRAMGNRYSGICSDSQVDESRRHAFRIKTDNTLISFIDQIQGFISQNLQQEIGDFIIMRNDQLFAYQLAVVVDDAFQQITHIVRGADLLESTPRQIYLQQQLSYMTPHYAHVPVALDQDGKKLSKQNFAEPLESSQRQSLMHRAFGFLGMNPPAGNASLHVSQQLEWGIQRWDIQNVPKLANISRHTIGS